MNYKMIICDVDGTIHTAKTGVPKITRKAFIEAQKKGIIVTLASGRSAANMKYIAEEAGINYENLYMIGLNGGEIFKLNNDKIETVYKKTFERDQAKTIYDLAKKFRVKIFVYTEDEHLAYINTWFSIWNIWLKFKTKKTIKVLKRSDLDTMPKITKVICFGANRNIKKLKKEFENYNFNIFSFSYVKHAKLNIEVSPPNIHKAYGIKELSKLYNIDSKDIVFFGDGENDIQAIKHVGHGVAMKNAMFDSVIKAANDTTKHTAGNGGVGHYLFDNILNKKDDTKVVKKETKVTTKTDSTKKTTVKKTVTKKKAK